MKSSFSKTFRSPFALFLLILIIIGLVTAIGPAEKSLGTNVRVVYLHGAWVWASIASFMVAGVAGLIGLITRRTTFHAWSRALGRTGLFFWITYLPISMWAMQTSWNGLFLSEPRWRLAMVFAISGLLLQIGLALLERPSWTSAANLAFVATLFVFLQSTQNVMHPPSPILNTNVLYIQIFFGGLLLLTMLAAWQVARWWIQFEGSSVKPPTL